MVGNITKMSAKIAPLMMVFFLDGVVSSLMTIFRIVTEKARC